MKLKTYMTKILTVLMLMMFSMGAAADVKIFYGEKGEEIKTGETKIKADNGTIAIEQKASDDGSSTTIYLTFTPNSGYTISTDNIEVYAVISTGSSPTRTAEISGSSLKLTEETSKDPEKRYSVKIDSNLGLWIKKAEFISGSKGNRGVINITTDTDGNGTIDDSEKNLYLIQTNQFESFYITPNGENLNTVNLPHSSMLWYFVEAENDNGTQYYYIVNNSTGYYICNSDYSSKGRTIKLLAFDDNSTDKFKFKFVENNPTGTTGYYNIDIKPNGGSYPALNKKGGNVLSTNGIQLTTSTYVSNINSRWKFIPYDGISLAWPDPPFTPSTDLEKHYYKIRNKKDNTYYISTNPSTGKVTYSSIESNDMAWYFKEASSDGLMKYYYVINPAAGNKYMYYDGNTSTSDKTSAVSIKDINEANAVADRFLFVIVQAAAVVGNTDDPDNGYYMIVPKLLIGNLWSSNSLGNKTPSDGSEMGIIAGRVNNDNAYPHWSFETTEYSTACGSPIITYSSTTGKVSITTTTTDAVIHYTIDGMTDPSSSNGTQYEDPFDVTEQTTIKAIVTRTGFTDSEVVTETIYQVETPTITINADNSVAIASATDGATIYYKLGGDDPTTENATQSASIASILPSQGPIKAFAIKDGCIHSDIATESNIPAKTITVSSSNGALTSEDPIVYDGTAHQPVFTIKDGETTISSEEYSSAYSDNTNAGTATITITDNADGDYNVSGSFTFTITQKPLTITAKDKEITYGDEPANDGVEYDGFIEGEGEDIEGIFTGTLSYDYSYSQYGDVGDTYTITPSGLTATNYSITFNNGTLTVSKKEVEIEWGSTSLGYTGSEQVPTATITNLVNNDEITVTVTGAKTDVGTGYEATVSGLSGPKADNYKLPSGTITTTFEIVKGTFTPTVSIDGWTYGETANTPSVSDNASGGDVTYTYTVKGEDDYSADVPTNAGNYTVQATIAATENYESVEATTDFTISPKSLGDGKDAATGIDIEMTQDGGNVEVTYVKDGELTLVVNKDYTVEIQAQGDDNYVIVTGIGNYTGSVQGLFVKPVFTKPTGATEAAAVYQASSDLAKPIDITPYIVIKVNPSIGTIAITPLDYIPEDVPVLLLSDAEAACFVASPKEESTPEITAQTKNSNLLKMAPEGGVEVKAAQKYMFYEGEFVLTKAGTLSAGKFYLYNPNYVATTTPTAQARGVLQLVIEEKTTGINDVRSKMEDVRDCYWYTLEGQRLNSKPTKPGLYIKNGKKTIIKKK